MTDALSPLYAAALVPLVALAAAAAGILVADLWKVPWRFSAWLALAGMVVTVALTLIVVLSGQSGVTHGMLVVDGTTATLTLFYCAAGMVLVLLELGSVRAEQGGRYALILLAVLGGAVVSQSTHALSLILGLATVYLASIALVGSAPAWQHYVHQSVGLACILLGIVLLYGAAGSLRTDLLIDRLAQQSAAGRENPLALVGSGLVLAGSGLFLGIVPLQTWITGTVPRMRDWDGCFASLFLPLVAAAVLSRFAHVLSPAAAQLAMLLGALSMLYGYTNALRHPQVGGVLGGITAAQSGTLLLNIVLLPTEGWIWLFYALGCWGLNLACLWAAAINARQEDGAPLEMTAIEGLGSRRPWLASALTLCLLNVAGMLPLAGGIHQLHILGAVMESGHPWILVLGLAMAANAAAWLLAGRWILAMWVSPIPERPWMPTTPEVGVVAVAAVGGMLIAGIYADAVLRWLDALIGGG